MADRSKSYVLPGMSGLLGTEEESRNVGERMKAVRLFSKIFIPGALIFASVDSYLHRFLIVDLLLGSAGAVAIGWYMLGDKRVALFEQLIMVVCTAICVGLLFDGGIVGSGTQWLLIYPFIAFFICGQRRGWYWVGAFVLATILLMLLHYYGRIELAYENRQLFYFFATFAFFTTIAAGLNLLRQRYERLLEVEVDAQSRTAFGYLKKLEYLAMYDPLTDLPNRHLAKDRIARAIEDAKRGSKMFAVALLDIERFHEVNVLLGHKQADRVLKMVGERLTGLMRGVDTVARLESDEFLLIWPGVDSASVEIVAKKVQAVMQKPFAVNGAHIRLSVRIGVVIYPQHGDTVATLLQHVSSVQRRAKAEHLAYAVYRSEWHSEALRRIHLLGKMRTSISEEGMVLVYQPQVQLADGKVTGVEALVRWHDPEEGDISPAEFVPLAEQSRLIDELTFMVLDMAGRQNRQWRDDGLDIRMSVNLSATHLIDLDLPDKIHECLQRYGGEPQHFKLEITETDIMAHPELAMSVMQKLDAMGIHLSIDDFGTGYSSFAYLRKLPVDELKIDQTFVRDFMRRESDRKIVASMVSLAHSLNLRVIAEGVEDAETWQALQKLGVDKAQGYLISRPLPPAEFVSWLQERQGSYAP